MFSSGNILLRFFQLKIEIFLNEDFSQLLLLNSDSKLAFAADLAIF